MLERHEKILIVAVSILIGLLLTTAVLAQMGMWSFTNTGKVTTSLQVKLNDALLANLDWGDCMLGPNNRSINIINIGNTAITLSMTNTISDHWISLSWNQEGTILQPNTTINATFTLTINDNATLGDLFNFSITIYGAKA